MLGRRLNRRCKFGLLGGRRQCVIQVVADLVQSLNTVCTESLGQSILKASGRLIVPKAIASMMGITGATIPRSEILIPP